MQIPTFVLVLYQLYCYSPEHLAAVDTRTARIRRHGGRGLHCNGGECPCQQHLNILATLHTLNTLNTHQTRGDTSSHCLYLVRTYELIALFLFVKFMSNLQSRNLM